MKISKVRKSDTEKLHFGLKLLIFDSLGLFDPHKI